MFPCPLPCNGCCQLCFWMNPAKRSTQEQPNHATKQPHVTRFGLGVTDTALGSDPELQQRCFHETETNIPEVSAPADTTDSARAERKGLLQRIRDDTAASHRHSAADAGYKLQLCRAAPQVPKSGSKPKLVGTHPTQLSSSNPGPA